MPRKLTESVVVVPGASSGIGKATALEFADRGATLVLGAWREERLDRYPDEAGDRYPVRWREAAAAAA